MLQIKETMNSLPIDSIKDVVEDICRRLNISDLCEQVLLFIQNLKENYLEPLDLNEEWIACIIYITMIEDRFVYGLLDSQLLSSSMMPTTLSDLLKATNVRASEFLQRMKCLQENISMSDAVLQHFSIVQKNILISYPLYRKFEKMHQEIFLDVNSQTSSLSEKSLCWLMYVTTKSSIQRNEGCLKLAESFHLLLCCLHHSIWSTPNSHLLPPFDTYKRMTASQTEDHVFVELCKKYGAGPDDVKFVMQNYFEPEVGNLSLANDEIDASQLLNIYTTYHKQLGDVNELDFLKNEFYLTTPSQQSQTPDTKTGCSNNADTPVRQTLAKIQSLKNTFKVTISHPTNDLLDYFNKCEQNPMQKIMTILSELEAIFVKAYTGRKGIARSRFKTATCVYYDVMAAMILSETERLGHNNFTSLLNNDVFHTSLFACSLEVVLHIYESHTLPFAKSFPSVSMEPVVSNFVFPWVIDIMKVDGFDFFKVVESFIRAKQDLPVNLKEHLLKIEEQILSYVGWQSGSQLMDSEFITSSINMTHFRIISGEPVPLNGQSNLVNLRIASNNSVKNFHSISVFLNKAFKLGLRRLRLINAVLKIPLELMSEISNCFDYCLRFKSDLFRDRHIDQILMCCLYGVPKVREHDIMFKQIISAYKSQLDGPLLKLEKNVLIANGERGPIIQFYNKIFLSELKSYLLKLNPNLPYQKPLDPNRNGCSDSQVSSPFKIPLTPRTSTLYCFKDSPLGTLRLLSKSDEPKISGRAAKRLQFVDD